MLKIIGKIDLSKIDSKVKPLKLKSDSSLYCCYCGEKFNPISKHKYKTSDHLVPLSKGGANNLYNKRNCCHFCNTQKADLLLQDFLIRIQETKLHDYEKTIRVENIKYLIDYINSSGSKVFKNGDWYTWYKKKYIEPKWYQKFFKK